MRTKRQFVVGITAAVGIVVLAIAAWCGWRYWTRPKPVPPKPAFELVHSRTVFDMHFSPDGRQLACAMLHGNRVCVRVYRLPDMQMIHQINTESRICVWNITGSLLAVVGDSHGQTIDLWDSGTWKRKHQLRVKFPRVLTPILLNPENICVDVERLCFDQWDNLYAAEKYSDVEGYVPPSIIRARVWWKTEQGYVTEGAPIEGEILNYYPSDISASSARAETRLAICYGGDCAIEILSVPVSRHGERSIEFTYQYCNWEPHHAWRTIRMTPDGAHLAARSSQEIQLLKLDYDHAEVVYSRRAPLGITLAEPQMVDISLDGRFAAYASKDRVNVIRIPSAAGVLEVPHGPFGFALSPDGQLLAVCDVERKAIVFYRIPQDGTK